MNNTLTDQRPKRFRDCERRLVLLDWLRSRHDHPTANACFTEIRRFIPNIGQSTVYRHLASLVDSGLIKELHTDDGPARYDASMHLHAHFNCVKCLAVIDADKISLFGRWPGTPDNVDLVARGTCEKCRTKTAS